jgi:hypothetical protein
LGGTWADGFAARPCAPVPLYRPVIPNQPLAGEESKSFECKIIKQNVYFVFVLVVFFNNPHFYLRNMI